MAITTQETVVLAEVEVTDEYRVQLRQHRKAGDYSPEDARLLGIELIKSAWNAEVLLAADVDRHARQAAATPPPTIDGTVVL